MWLFQHFQDCSASADLVEVAALAGHLHRLDADIPNEGDPRNSVFWGGKDMRMAAKRRHGDIVRWLYGNVRGVERELNRVMIYAVRKLLSNVYRDMPHLQLMMPPQRANFT